MSRLPRKVGAAIGLLFFISVIMGLTTPAYPAELAISSQAKEICARILVATDIPTGKELQWELKLAANVLLQAHTIKSPDLRDEVQTCLVVHHSNINVVNQEALVSSLAFYIHEGGFKLADLDIPKNLVLSAKNKSALDAAFKR